MQKASLSIQKTEARKLFEQNRSSLPAHRREHAKVSIAKHFGTKIPLLSFFSCGTEIDLSLLNQQLAHEKLLFLPRIENGVIVPYRVLNLNALHPSPSYRIHEPDPSHCVRADLSEITAILVPALAFDPEHYRLGYGKGHYDRFLAHVKIRTIGVGFKEQLSSKPLPRDPWDIPVDELFLT